MLRLLLTFISIGIVCCQDLQNCPLYSTLENDPSLLNALNGTFYKVLYTGTKNVAACQKQIFTVGPNNVLSGYLESPDFCLRLNNCDTSRTDYYQCDNTPLSGTVGSLPSTQKNYIKLVETIGSGDNLCLTYAYCRVSEEGVYVLCRNKLPFIPELLLSVTSLLDSVLNLIAPTQVWQQVRQTNCNFLNACPP